MMCDAGRLSQAARLSKETGELFKTTMKREVLHWQLNHTSKLLIYMKWSNKIVNLINVL